MTISLKNITKKYDDFTAVNSISFSIPQSQIVAVLGSNGAGKSTTLKMICGLIKPSQGELLIHGLSYDTKADEIKKNIGYVPEESALYEDISVEEYLLFFSELMKIPRKTAMQRINELKAYFDLPDTKKLIGALSKGMKRKVLLMRALLNNPTTLIFDEPASGLDPNVAQSILNKMQELKKEHKTIIFSSHNLLHVERIADRVIVIVKGKIAFDGTVHDLKKKTKTTYRIIEDGIEKTVDFTYIQKNIGNISSVEPLSLSIEEAFLSLTK